MQDTSSMQTTSGKLADSDINNMRPSDQVSQALSGSNGSSGQINRAAIDSGHISADELIEKLLL